MLRGKKKEKDPRPNLDFFLWMLDEVVPAEFEKEGELGINMQKSYDT